MDKPETEHRIGALGPPGSGRASSRLGLRLIRGVAISLATIGLLEAVLFVDANRWKPSWIGAAVLYVGLVIGVPVGVYRLFIRRGWSQDRSSAVASALSIVLQIPFLPFLVLFSVFSV